MHVCLGEDHEIDLGLTITESVSFYFAGILGLSSMYSPSDINPPISKYLLTPLKISIIFYKQISNYNLYAIAGVVHAPFMIFLLTITSMH